MEMLVECAKLSMLQPLWQNALMNKSDEEGRDGILTSALPGLQSPQDPWQDLSMKLGFRSHSPLLAHRAHLSCMGRHHL